MAPTHTPRPARSMRAAWATASLTLCMAMTLTLRAPACAAMEVMGDVLMDERNTLNKMYSEHKKGGQQMQVTRRHATPRHAMPRHATRACWVSTCQHVTVHVSSFCAVCAGWGNAARTHANTLTTPTRPPARTHTRTEATAPHAGTPV